ncbi:hypothetical protein DMW47_25160, partial [Serratia marcescens]
MIHYEMLHSRYDYESKDFYDLMKENEY